MDDAEDYGMRQVSRDHLNVLLEALSVQEERTAAYGDAWKQYGALAMLLKAAGKVDRLMETWYHGLLRGETPDIHKEALDDAFDGINYLAFFIRACREANFTGSPPFRPQYPWNEHETFTTRTTRIVRLMYEMDSPDPRGEK